MFFLFISVRIKESSHGVWAVVSDLRTYSSCREGMCENIASLTSEKVPLTMLLGNQKYIYSWVVCWDI